MAGIIQVSTTGYVSLYAIVISGNTTHDASATSARAIAGQLRVDFGQNLRRPSREDELADSGKITFDIPLTYLS